jgi:hypothetical protein
MTQAIQSFPDPKHRNSSRGVLLQKFVAHPLCQCDLAKLWLHRTHRMLLSAQTCCRSARCHPTSSNHFVLKSASFPLNSKSQARRLIRRARQLLLPAAPLALVMPLQMPVASALMPQLNPRRLAKVRPQKQRIRNRSTQARTRGRSCRGKARCSRAKCRA